MASRSWNRVELIGNLTRDPELRFTPNGAAVCTFGMATNRTYVSEGERKEEVDFHRLVAWNKLAELCNQLLKKGIRVFISGRLQTRSWEGQDGQTRQTTEIVIEDMIILTPKSNGGLGMSEDFEISSPKTAVEGPKREKVSEPQDDEPVSKKEEKASEESEPKESRPKDDGPLAQKVSEKAPQEEVKDDLPF